MSLTSKQKKKRAKILYDAIFYASNPRLNTDPEYLRKAKEIIDRTDDSNYYIEHDYMHNPPLINASGLGNEELVKFLLKRPRANVNLIPPFRESALRKAITNGKPKIVKLLLDHGAKYWLREDGQNALEYAKWLFNLNKDRMKYFPRGTNYRAIVQLLEEVELRRLRKFDLDVSSRIREKKNRDSIRSRARRFIYNRNNPEFMRKYREAHKRYQNQLRLRRINKALGIVSAQYLGDTKPMFEHGKKRRPGPISGNTKKRKRR